MIRWCLGIWNESDTQYISADPETGEFILSPFLEHAVLFKEIRSGNPLGTCWLPVFTSEDLIEE